jgi:hypothetical protein
VNDSLDDPFILMDVVKDDSSLRKRFKPSTDKESKVQEDSKQDHDKESLQVHGKEIKFIDSGFREGHKHKVQNNSLKSFQDSSRKIGVQERKIKAKFKEKDMESKESEINWKELKLQEQKVNQTNGKQEVLQINTMDCKESLGTPYTKIAIGEVEMDLLWDTGARRNCVDSNWTQKFEC